MAGDLVLITGATGTVGFRTLVVLLNEGFKARLAIRSEASFNRIKNLAPIQPYLSSVETVIVSNITAAGAYEEAVKGVKYIIHMASPTFPTAEDQDWENDIVKPAVEGTVGILYSANKEPGIKRISFASSALSLAPLGDLLAGQLINESRRTSSPSGPYPEFLLAYVSSKILCFNETERFIAEHKSSFEVVNIQPTFVLGRDDTVTNAEDIVKGTNGYILGPLLGHARSTPIAGSSVHIDDVAQLQVRALSADVLGNKNYIASCQPPNGVDWAEAFEIVKKHFPKECAEGIFKVDRKLRPTTLSVKVDSSLAQKTFGITFKSYESQIVSIASHYLELLGRR